MKQIGFWVLALTALACGGAGAQYGYSQSCADATDAAESAANSLAYAASNLESCARDEDFENDCTTEFYDVEAAHGDYESAVSDIDSECDS